MFKLKQLLKAISFAGMVLLLGTFGTLAATLTVTTTADSGIGSLRQALIDANTNAESNTVEFAIPISDPGYNAAENRFSIILVSSLPDVPLAPLSISNTQTQALTIKGNNTFRIFTLVNSAVLDISNLTVSNGSTSLLRPGKSLGGGTDGQGGAFYMGDSSTLTINNCTVSDNSASASGGAVYVSNSGTLFITESTIRGNSASDGGGVYLSDSGTLNIEYSTMSANSVGGGDGGAVYNGTSGTVNATSNTFDGNSAGNGGAIYNAATITFIDNTITSNTAGFGGGISNQFVATLNNNLVALNTAADGPDLLGRAGMGSAFSGVYNLIGNADGSEGLSGAPNRSGTTGVPIDPLIGPLRNNGGPTLTRELLTGSPAMDKGDSPTMIRDQRGAIRPFDNATITNEGGNGADIGAYEASLTPSAALVNVSGRVLSSTNDITGLWGATVFLTDDEGTTRTALTNGFGYFSFENVQAGESYVIGVQDKRYRFETRILTVQDEITDITLVAQETTNRLQRFTSHR